VKTAGKVLNFMGEEVDQETALATSEGLDDYDLFETPATIPGTATGIGITGDCTVNNCTVESPKRTRKTRVTTTKTTMTKVQTKATRSVCIVGRLFDP